MREFEHEANLDRDPAIRAFTTASETTPRITLGCVRRRQGSISGSSGLRDTPRARRDDSNLSAGKGQRCHTSILASRPSPSFGNTQRHRGAVCLRAGCQAAFTCYASQRPPVHDRESGGRLARPASPHALLAGWSRSDPRGLFCHSMGSRSRLSYRATSIDRRAAGYREPQAHLTHLTTGAGNSTSA